MSYMDRFIHLVLSGILIIGVYQFYFFTQKHVVRPVKIFNSPIDEKIPFWPWWSWIYSFLYYPAILYLNWVIQDSREFIIIVFSYIILLLMQMFFFTVFPVSTPAHWRQMNKGEKHQKNFYYLYKNLMIHQIVFPVCMYQ